MPDMDKVKKALEYCDNSEDCRGCVYWEETLHINDCPVNRYALELLKEQDAEIERLKKPTAGDNKIPLRW